MAESTKIQWADATFNGVIGCQKVSPGCAHCYAEGDTPARVSRERGLELWGPPGRAVRRVVAESTWANPVAWAKKARREGRRLRVFAYSQADVFEAWSGPVCLASGARLYTLNGETWFPAFHWSVTSQDSPCPPGFRWVTMDDVRDRLHALMALTPSLDWLVLTKRPEVALAYYGSPMLYRRVLRHAALYWRRRFKSLSSFGVPDPASAAFNPNRWLGVSVEDQAHADARLPALADLPTLLPWVSYEPALGPVDWDFGRSDRPPASGRVWTERADWLKWVVVGGESGEGARPFHLGWARDTLGQCRAAGVRVFVKQIGSKPVQAAMSDAGPLTVPYPFFDGPPNRDPKGGDPEEWPEDLRVREWPESPAARLAPA